MPLYDEFADTVSAPATRGSAVTPHASNPLPAVPKALYIGTGGNLVVRLLNDIADVTFKNVPAGTVLPIRASHVRATSTAADIVALG